MEEKKILAVDMDEVVADAVPRFIEWYERDTGIRLTMEEIDGGEAWEAVRPEHLETAGQYVFQKGFFKDLPVMEDSQEVIRELMEHYEVFFVETVRDSV